MSAKRITFWERCAGPVVVAGAVVAAAMLAGRAFLVTNTVVVSLDDRAAPGEIDRRLADYAARLAAQLDARAPAPIELPEPPSAQRRLVEALAARSAPPGPLPLPAISVGPRPDGIPAGPNVLFAIPTIPAPTETRAASFLGTLASKVPAAYPELARFLPVDQPPDVVWVTAAARIDLADLREAFTAGREPIPRTWSEDGLARFLDVVIERETLIDGHWTDRVVLDPLPGRFSFRSRLAGPLDSPHRDEIITLADDPIVRLEVVQPPFYPLRGGAWAPPIRQEDDGDDPRLGELRLLRGQQRQLIRFLLARYGVRYEDPPPPRGEQGDPPRGRGGGRGVPGRQSNPEGGGAKRPKGVDAPDAKALERLIERIQQLGHRIRELESEVPNDAGDVGEPLDPAVADELWVWGHDLTAESGGAYRYAIAVRIYNPLFGRARSLAPEQRHLAEAITLDSPRSAWSEPVVAERITRLWITRAQMPRAGAGLGRATAEVDRYYDGRHWRAVFGVQPGDPIGGPRKCRAEPNSEPLLVDFTTGLAVLDIVERLDPQPGRPPGEARVLLEDLRTRRLDGPRDPRIEGPVARMAPAGPGSHCSHP